MNTKARKHEITKAFNDAIVICLLAAAPLAAQTVTLLTPSTGATVTGVTAIIDCTSTVAGMPSGGTVEYWLNGKPYSPPVSSAGSYDFKFFNALLANGIYTVQAVMRDSTGAVVATSSAASVTVSSYNSGGSVTTSTDLSGNKSGTLSVAFAVTAPGTVERVLYAVDGQVFPPIYAVSGTFLIDTTRYQDGVHELVITAYSGGGPTAAIGFLQKQITFLNAPGTYQEMRSGLGLIYLTPGETATLSPRRINTDGTSAALGGSTFSSSNTAAATVSVSGVITAVGTGMAAITTTNSTRTTTTIAEVVPSHLLKHFGKAGGAFLTAYDASNSLWQRSMYFFSSTGLTDASSGNHLLGPAGIAAGLNAMEENLYFNPFDYPSYTLFSQWQAAVDPTYNNALSIAAANGYAIFGIGDNIARSSTADASYMNNSITGSYSAQALQYAFNKLKPFGTAMVDEITYNWCDQPFPSSGNTYWSGTGACAKSPSIPDNAFTTLLSRINGGSYQPLMDWPVPYGASTAGYANWNNNAQGHISDYEDIYWVMADNHTAYPWGSSAKQNQIWLDSIMTTRTNTALPWILGNVAVTGPSYTKADPSGNFWRPGTDPVVGLPSAAIPQNIWYAVARGAIGERLYGLDDPGKVYGEVHGGTGAYEQTFLDPYCDVAVRGNACLVTKANWSILSANLNGIKAIEPYILKPLLNSVDLGPDFTVGAHGDSAARVLIVVNNAEAPRTARMDWSSYQFSGGQVTRRRYQQGGAWTDSAVASAASATEAFQPGEVRTYVFTPGGGSSPMTITAAPTSTDVILTYNPPDTGACTIQVSESGTYSPLVHGVDPALFTGAGSDSSVITSGTRQFQVAGAKVRRGVDGRAYSTALQANTLHYAQVTCPGPVTAVTTFTTRNIPLGSTYSEPVPADAASPGEALLPDVSWSDRTETIIDPQTGAQLKRVSLPSDRVQTFSAQSFASASGWTNPAGALNSAGATTTGTGALFLSPALPGFSASYDTEHVGNKYLNWIQVTVTAAVPSCSGDTCVIRFCLTQDSGATCSARSNIYERTLTAAPAVVTAGTQNTMDVWQPAGSRPLNGVEVNGVAFGIRIWRKASDANTVTLSNAALSWQRGQPIRWTDSGSYDICSRTTVAGPGTQQGYNCATLSNGNIYWIGATTGESHLIARNLGYNFGGFDSSPFDSSDPDTIYGGAASNLPLYKMKYFGDHDDHGGFEEGSALPACTGSGPPYSNQPCTVAANLTAGTSIQAIAHAYDSTFPATQNWYLEGVNTDNRLIIRATRGGTYTAGWALVFDPSATVDGAGGTSGCVGGGHPGCITALLNSMQAPNCRWCPVKALNFLSTDGWVGVGGYIPADPDPAVSPDTYNAGRGPWRVHVTDGTVFNSSFSACPTNPLGITGNNCTTATVDGEPRDPTPCTADTTTCFGALESGAAGEYGTAAIGDWAYVGPGSGPAISGNNEVVVLVAKSGTSWTWARAQGPLAGGSPVVASVTAPYLYMLCNSQITPLHIDVGTSQAYWHYAVDPHGTNAGGMSAAPIFRGRLTFAGKVAISGGLGMAGSGSGILRDAYSLNAHYTFTPGYLTSGYCILGGCSRGYGADSYSTRTFSSIPALMTTNTTSYQTLNPQFTGKASPADGNHVQEHPNGSGLSAPGGEKSYFFDIRPFNGDALSGSAGSPAVNLAGQLWKFAGSQITSLNRKHMATWATAGRHPLIDVSGPGSILGTTSADSWKYCVAAVVNECRSGAAAGDVYVNAPGVTYGYCYSPGQDTQLFESAVDLCIGDNDLVYNSLMQIGQATDTTGAGMRSLTKGLTVPRMNHAFSNAHSLANGRFLLFNTPWAGMVADAVFALKLPPPPASDGVDRTAFIPYDVVIPAPGGGATSAYVRFGYTENGGSGTYCTSRAENCAVTAGTINAANPFSWETADTYTPLSCASGCTIRVPALSGKVLNYQVIAMNGSTLVTAGPVTKVAIQ